MSGRFDALLHELILTARARQPGPALIGVGGAQGSGKTTLCRAYAEASGGRVAHFSLDDVYLTRAERERLAETRHPLFITRGPPGTHDLKLAEDTIDALCEAAPDTRTPLPHFDKARDDRAPPESWPVFTGRPTAILVDGWCMGAAELGDEGAPINALEAEEDAGGAWRKAVAEHLASDYWSFFDPFDAMVYLQAPSFDIVRSWRGQQEEEMLGRAMTDEERVRLDRFIQHYERITRAMLGGQHIAEWIVRLDEGRAIVAIDRYE